ncbi:hypothetical protein ACXJJ3_32940 [Kribbella sp. WER1]
MSELSDILKQLTRIADAIEPVAADPSRCDGTHGNITCPLDDGHSGYHVSPDGQFQWLDEGAAIHRTPLVYASAEPDELTEPPA